MFDGLKQGIKRRSLRMDEIIFAKYVFGNSLPYDEIKISNTIGFGKREFTTPALRKKNGLVLHLGVKGFDSAISPIEYRHIFIHEMVHIWQSVHWKNRWGFVGDSVCQQVVLMKGQKAYNYELGKKWSDYHAEQQASIISDWYYWGGIESDPQFEYVKNHLRRGIN